MDAERRRPFGLGGKTQVKKPAHDMNVAHAALDGRFEIVPAEHQLIALRDRVG